MFQVFTECLERHNDVFDVKAKYNEFVQYTFNIIEELIGNIYDEYN